MSTVDKSESSTNVVQRKPKQISKQDQKIQNPDPTTPNFVLGGYEHDQNSFMGRLNHQFETTSPKLMFKSDKQIVSAQNLIKKYQENPEEILEKYGHRELWNAQQLQRASTNADTGEIIPVPFRLCGFVSFNMPVLVGLVWPGIGTFGSLFWQWINQTHNGAINFYNGNKTNPTDPKLLTISYIGACAGAMGVRLGVGKYIYSRKSWSAAQKIRYDTFAAFPAVLVANTINIFAMRSQELKNGIEVVDKETGKILGKSKEAAKRAIGETALSRAIISAGVLMCPPLLDGVAQKRVAIRYAKSPHLKKIQTTTLVVICAFCFYAVLPISVAAFSQYREMPSDCLESDLKKKAKSKEVIFNRGQ